MVAGQVVPDVIQVIPGPYFQVLGRRRGGARRITITAYHPGN
jgi:hypothetical protein